MKAMVFAAGRGSRLGPLGSQVPKALVPVRGLTMLERVINRLKQVGVDEVVINVHHLARIIEKFVESKDLGVKIHLSREETLLGTGGGLLKAREYFENEELFFVHNVDIYCEYPLEQVLAFHRKHGGLGTLLTQQRETARYLVFNADSELVGWKNVKTGEASQGIQPGSKARAFSGIQVLSGGIFKYLEQESRETFATIGIFLNAASAGEKILSLDIESTPWFDVGTVERLANLSAFLGKADAS